MCIRDRCPSLPVRESGMDDGPKCGSRYWSASCAAVIRAAAVADHRHRQGRGWRALDDGGAWSRLCYRMVSGGIGWWLRWPWTTQGRGSRWAAGAGEPIWIVGRIAVSYTHLRAHETPEHLVCRLLLEK